MPHHSDPEDDTDFVNIINASLEPRVIDESEGVWILVQLTDDVYEVVFKTYEIDIQLEAAAALVRHNLHSKNMLIAQPHRLEDGKVAVTLVRRRKD